MPFDASVQVFGEVPEPSSILLACSRDWAWWATAPGGNALERVKTKPVDWLGR